MELISQPILGFLRDPLRRRPRALALHDAGIAVRGGERSWVRFTEIAAKPTMTRGMLSSSLALELNGGVRVVLSSVDGAVANAFAEAVGDAWSKFNLDELAKEEGAIRRLLKFLDELKGPDWYPAACRVDPVAREAIDLTTRVLSKLNAAAVGAETMNRVAPIVTFSADPTGAREVAIERFVASELDRWKEFLDTVESKPLTPEQRLSVVVDEDATLPGRCGLGQDQCHHGEDSLPGQGWYQGS